MNRRGSQAGELRAEIGVAEVEVEGATDLREQMNEDRRRRFGSPGRTLALLCECGDTDCHRTVLLSAEDYDAVRPAPVVHPDHVVEVPLQ
jgi:hypothetical protein